MANPTTPLAQDVVSITNAPAATLATYDFARRTVRAVEQLELEAANLWKTHQVAVIAFMAFAVGVVTGLWV